MARIVIFGAGAVARLADYYFTRDSDHSVLGFCVDDAFLEGSTFLDRPLVGFTAVAERFPPDEYSMFVALSYARMNGARADVVARVKALGYQLESYVSSRCTNLTDAPVGENCFVLEDNTIQPFVRIGNDVTLWSGNHIGHDSVIHDHCFITSHVVVSGNCQVGERCFVGVNATIHDGVTLAPRTLVGAGGIVAKNTREGGVYVPVRARLLNCRSEDFLR